MVDYKEILAVIDRHEKRLEAVGDKQMSAERDLTTVLEFLEEVAPVLEAARDIHLYRDSAMLGTDSDLKDKVGGLLIRLAILSTAMKVAGMVGNK